MHLCNKLDNLDKDIKRHVSGHDAPTPFGEQSGGDGRQATGGGGRRNTYVALMTHIDIKNQV